MTEDEAKMKWCPLARDSNTSGNRMQYGGDGEPADPDYRLEPDDVHDEPEEAA